MTGPAKFAGFDRALAVAMLALVLAGQRDPGWSRSAWSVVSLIFFALALFRLWRAS